MRPRGFLLYPLPSHLLPLLPSHPLVRIPSSTSRAHLPPLPRLAPPRIAERSIPARLLKMPHHGGRKKKNKGGKGKPRKKTDDRGEANVGSGDSSPAVRVEEEAEVEAEAEVGTAVEPQRSGTLASPTDVVEAAQHGQRQQQASQSQQTPSPRSCAAAVVNKREDETVGYNFLQFLRRYQLFLGLMYPREHKTSPM